MPLALSDRGVYCHTAARIYLRSLGASAAQTPRVQPLVRLLSYHAGPLVALSEPVGPLAAGRVGCVRVRISTYNTKSDIWPLEGRKLRYLGLARYRIVVVDSNPVVHRNMEAQRAHSTDQAKASFQFPILRYLYPQHTNNEQHPT